MSIEVKPSEIDAVNDIGDLDGFSVKLVRTKGGLYIALGRPKGKSKDEVLAAGSHPAIVKYNIEKSYSSFQSSMMKSELLGDGEARDMTSFLPEDLSKGSYDLYVIEKNNEFDFILTKSQIEVLKFNSIVSGDDLILFKSGKLIPSELFSATSSIAKAAAQVALKKNKKHLIHSNKKYDPKEILKKK